jgi:putative transposase
MKQQSIAGTETSSVTWENMEAWVRAHVQGFIQQVLEEEVSVFLGRQKSQRRGRIDAGAGYRNGHGHPRRLTLSCGTITVQRPRIRGSEGRFESRVLPLFKRKSQAVERVLPELYLHGLAQDDVELALRGLLGEDAPLSGPTIARMKEKWHAELAVWQTRRLEELQAVYLWVDGMYVKAGLEKDKAALLVVLAALSDGRKVVLAVTPGHRESTASWAAVLRDLRDRGLRAPRLVIGDGHLGIWSAVRHVYPEAREQRCWNHRILTVLDKLPKRQQGAAKALLCPIPYAPTRREAEQRRDQFVHWCQHHGFPAAARCLEADWDRLVAFYRFPQPHWQHLRTTNPVESPFAAARLRTDAAKRFRVVKNATAVIWKILLVAERTFRRVKHPELMPVVYRGGTFIDGLPVNKEVAA